MDYSVTRLSVLHYIQKLFSSWFIYAFKFLNLTTRKSLHQPLTDGRDTTQACYVKEELHVYISDAVYDATRSQLSWLSKKATSVLCKEMGKRTKYGH